MRPRPNVLAIAVAVNFLIAVAAIAHGYFRSANHNPSRYFGEGRWTMAVGCLEMLSVAFFAIGVFVHRRRRLLPMGQKGYRVWWLIGAGFVFLALDDALQIHEELDHWLHRAFHLPDTGLTDRIDDAILVSYALIGLAVLWGYRRELIQFRPMLPALVAGFIFTMASFVCDTVSNRPDFFQWAGADSRFAARLEGWFAAWEGSFQLLALGAFAASFYVAWQQSRRLAGEK